MPTAFGYRPSISRHTLKTGYPICTSITFNRSGAIRPEAFGVEIEGMRYRYKIKSITAFKENHGSFSFDCEYVELGRIKSVRLIFDINLCLWSIG